MTAVQQTGHVTGHRHQAPAGRQATAATSFADVMRLAEGGSGAPPGSGGLNPVPRVATRAVSGASGAAQTQHHAGGRTGAAGCANFIGRSSGSGQCVALVHAVAPSIGSTHTWVRGAPVKGNAGIQPGTPIATFGSSGRYENATDGRSHAAIYLGQNAQGIQVMDQWAGSPAAMRTIRWTNPGGKAADTGTAFHVVRST